ncbi:MAG TPA: hypothetical protein PKY82_22675 [Pyrinomonadaceae bacterium]|nr:hypothetical protein [Pyrinomonadaceae bacterium]
MDIFEANKILNSFFEKYPNYKNQSADEVVNFIKTLPFYERIPLEKALAAFAKFGGWKEKGH